MENRVRDAWRQNQCAINGWLCVPSAFSAELMMQTECDSLCIDLQHGLIDYRDAVVMMQAMDVRRVSPLVRVPWNEPGIIMKCLDAGAIGIVCPMVNTRADAEQFVSACRYPPLGIRSSGPVRAQLVYGDEYQADANTGVIAFAQIETAQALDNLESILAVPGLDAVYIGSSDLAISMGYVPGIERSEPQLLEAIDHILERSKYHRVRAAIHCSGPAHAKRMMGKGFDLVTALTDSRLILQGGKQAMAELRSQGQ